MASSVCYDITVYIITRFIMKNKKITNFQDAKIRVVEKAATPL